MSKPSLTVAVVVAVAVAVIGISLGVVQLGDDSSDPESGTPSTPATETSPAPPPSAPNAPGPPQGPRSPHVLALLPGISQSGAEPVAADAAEPVLLVTSPPATVGQPLTIHRRLLAKGTGEVLDADPDQPGDQDLVAFGSGLVVEAEGESWLTVPARDAEGNTWQYVARSAGANGTDAWSNAVVAGSGWELVTEDEFNGSELGSMWQHRNGPEEAREDCDTAPSFDHGRNRNRSTDRVTHVADGVLRLTVRRAETCADGRLVHESGHVGTQEQPAYGAARHLFAARVKFPATSGNHAAFWVRGADTSSPGSEQDVNEIDISESFGPHVRACGAGGHIVLDRAEGRWTGLQSNVYYAFQVPDGSGPGGYKNCVGLDDAAGAPGLEDGAMPWEAYHVYSAEWVPGQYVKIRYDGELIHTYTGRLASRRPVFVVLSNSVSDGAQIQGSGDSSMKVDWVRVWKHR